MSVPSTAPAQAGARAHRMTLAEAMHVMQLRTPKRLIDAYAIRTPDGVWYLCMRGFGVREQDAPDRFIDALPAEQVALEHDASAVRCGKGRAVMHV